VYSWRLGQFRENVDVNYFTAADHIDERIIACCCGENLVDPQGGVFILSMKLQSQRREKIKKAKAILP
jgi:hypothetical protein